MIFFMPGVPLLAAKQLTLFPYLHLLRRTPEARLIIHPGSRSSGSDACHSALGKEHDLCQKFRGLIGKSLGLKGGSMGLRIYFSESLGNGKSR